VAPGALLALVLSAALVSRPAAPHTIQSNA
jgi:hypothetical protein